MIKSGNVTVCLKGLVAKIFDTVGKIVANDLPFIGWYNPGYALDLQADTAGNIAAGNRAIFYWNAVIDRYNPSGAQFNSYTEQSYIIALNNLLASTNKKVIIDLPYWNIFGTYNAEDKITSWWEGIINATKNNPKVIGYYLFDEAEVWGYNNNIPELTHTEALNAYNLAKSFTTKDLYSVFTDVTLFNQKYGLDGNNQVRTPFWDVFMFDAYDFLEQSKLESNCSANSAWCFTAGSQQEKNFIEQRLLSWKTNVIIPNNISRVVFVMQGHGETRQNVLTGAVTSVNGVDVFGMRTITNDEYSFIVNILKTQFTLEGILAWSWFYGNNISRQRANTALLLLKN